MCVPSGQGDYYYGGPVPGGTAVEILNVSKNTWRTSVATRTKGRAAPMEDPRQVLCHHQPAKLPSPESAGTRAVAPVQVWLVQAVWCSPRAL